jgi:hypothetical protein
VNVLCLCEGDAQQRLAQSKLVIEEANKKTVEIQRITAPMSNNLTTWSQTLQTFDSSAYNTAVDSARDAGITEGLHNLDAVEKLASKVCTFWIRNG